MVEQNTSTALPKMCSGTFRLYIGTDGNLIVPDLAEHLIPICRKLGVPESLWQKKPCSVTSTQLRVTSQIQTGLGLSELPAQSSSDLWGLHDWLIRKKSSWIDSKQPLDRMGLPSASLLDLKIELARRMISPCQLCEHRCGVNRGENERGFCGLGAETQLAAYANIYNEGPLIGAPTFSIYTRGCSLRCGFCYRREELATNVKETMTSQELATLLDMATQQGAVSWHFLGGNPDQSIYGILMALALTATKLPVAWNSNLLLTPEAIMLLKGVVDIWIPDFKFGDDRCAKDLSGAEGYVETICRNLRLLEHETHVVIRHMAIPGHEECCRSVIRQWVEENLPHAHFDLLQLYLC